jgi:TPR repeat protein
MACFYRPSLAILSFMGLLLAHTTTWAMDNDKDNFQSLASVSHILQGIDGDNPESLVVPSGALENEEPFQLKVPRPGFEEKVKNPQLQQNTLRSLGMDPTEENQQTYFSKPQELSRYLKNNLWGPKLLLGKVSFQTPQELLILDGVGETKSLRELSLKGAYLIRQAYLALANALGRNQSLKVLDLTGASCSFDDLTLLGYALSHQKSLRELRLKAKFEVPLTIDNIKDFYNQITLNTGLRFIEWPEECLPIIRMLSDGVKGHLFAKEQPPHPVAALHRGMMFKMGIGEGKDLKKSLQYLELAHKLGHPLAAYEIAKIYEKEEKDFPKALEWINKSTEKGNLMAFVKRGDHFRKTWPKQQDISIQPDYEKAHQNYKIAADHGHRLALYRLGKMYESGRHVQKDLNKAGEFFFQSCQKGFPDAYTALGALYNNPEYSQYDVETAKYYLRWGQYHPKSRPTATKLLNYIEQEEKKKKENTIEISIQEKEDKDN